MGKLIRTEKKFLEINFREIFFRMVDRLVHTHIHNFLEMFIMDRESLEEKMTFG